MWCNAQFGTICTILKTWKTPMKECYFLVKLYGKAWTLLKVTLLHGYFSCFLNCTKWYQTVQTISFICHQGHITFLLEEETGQKKLSNHFQMLQKVFLKGNISSKENKNLFQKNCHFAIYFHHCLVYTIQFFHFFSCCLSFYLM